MASRSNTNPPASLSAPKSDFELVEAFKKAFERFDSDHMSTPAKALATLQREGILAADGTPTKHYRD